jgi:hypothetical protein
MMEVESAYHPCSAWLARGRHSLMSRGNFKHACRKRRAAQCWIDGLETRNLWSNCIGRSTHSVKNLQATRLA